MTGAARRLAIGLAALASACNGPAMTTSSLSIAGATPASYDALRDASGAIGFAETSLSPDLAKSGFTTRPGASPVARDRVEGAWELPGDMDVEALVRTLGGSGVVTDAQTWRDGQLWTARYRPHGGSATTLLFIDGTHANFKDQPPELRPAAKRYLIAYRAG